MSTQKTFTATTMGTIWAEIISHIGAVNVTVDPTLKSAEVTVRTADDEGPMADAVNDTVMDERDSNGHNVMEIRVPKLPGGGGVHTSVQIGGNNFSSYSFSGSNTGVVMSGGDIFMGGRQIVSNGRVVAEAGTVVGGVGSGQIIVDVKLPAASSVRLNTTSADLTVLRGTLHTLDVRSVSGDVEAKSVHTLRGNTTSGDFEVDKVAARVDVTSVSGDIEIGEYSGSDFRANTVSGDVHVTATPAATGSIDATTVSGDVVTRGASHLNVRANTVSGRKRNR
ncbi:MULTISPECIES: DUF4097 family beta strand repeat-containing protein [unclassified Streptomyces]|uniref:DUF4097 family beta strand repeat-containing protein n=1 Tax=unclassified Streptomyces TaxID=2593676 RepID=UPI0013C52E07|nr:DUF4097 family beta strand repeat-containing protein [Streptomyces sp. 11-1-2]